MNKSDALIDARVIHRGKFYALRVSVRFPNGHTAEREAKAVTYLMRATQALAGLVGPDHVIDYVEMAKGPFVLLGHFEVRVSDGQATWDGNPNECPFVKHVFRMFENMGRKKPELKAVV